MAKRKGKKKPVFEPFNNSSGLELFETDFTCEGTGKTNLETLDLSDLEILQEQIQEDIADYDTIIEIQLDEKSRCIAPGRVFDNENLANDRRRRQQLVVELRKVKERIKMIKNNSKELSVA